MEIMRHYFWKRSYRSKPEFSQRYAPGVFAEGGLAFCHETGIDAANVLRDDGVLASAAFDASSIVGSVMPKGGRLWGAYRCGRDAGASGAVEAFVAKFIVEHNGRDEKKDP